MEVFAAQVAASLCSGPCSEEMFGVLPRVSCSRWCGLPVGVSMMNRLQLDDVFMTKRRCCM